MPGSNSFTRTPLESHLSESKKSRGKEIFDIFSSGNETRILHPGGIRFIQKEKKHISFEIGPAKVISEEAVFYKKAVSGKFLPDGRAIVLLEDGSLSRLDFSNSTPMTFLLFEKLPKLPPEIYPRGDSYWFVLPGTPDIVKVLWKGEKDVSVLRFRCKKIDRITEGMKVECDKDRCRIFGAGRLLEEIK